MNIHNANSIGRVFIWNSRGGSNMQDEYLIIGGLHGIAQLISQLAAPVLMAQL
jgi:hypothetical protein